MKQPTKQTKESAMNSLDLQKKIDDARFALSTILMEGGDTSKHRAFLNELLAEQQKLNDALVAQETAQAALKEVERQRVNDDAARLLEARNNRIAAIAKHFAIPSNA
jgi:hypothetical protein